MPNLQLFDPKEYERLKHKLMWVFFIAIILVFINEVFQITPNWLKTTGIVTKVEKDTERVKVYYKYKINDIVYNGVDSIIEASSEISESKLQTGQKISIRYKQRNKKKSTLIWDLSLGDKE